MAGRPKKRQEIQKYTTTKKHNSPIINRLNGLITEKNRKDFCNALGITERTVYHWKNGQARPDIDRLADIANYFNVTTDYLTGRTSNPAPTQDIAKFCEITGLSVKAVEFFITLNIPLNDSVNIELCETISGMTREEVNLSKEKLSEVEKQNYIDYVKYNLRQKIIKGIDFLTGTPVSNLSWNENNNYGYLLFSSIADYLFNNYNDEELYSKDGMINYGVLTAERRRDQEISKIHIILNELRKKIENEKK